MILETRSTYPPNTAIGSAVPISSIALMRLGGVAKTGADADGRHALGMSNLAAGRQDMQKLQEASQGCI